MTHAVSSEEHPRIVTLMTNPRGQVVFSIFALGAILFLIADFYILCPYDGMNMGFYRSDFLWVDAVYAGGPAEKAGVLLGDRILSVEGRPIDASSRWPVHRPGIGPGDTVVYELLRGRQVVTLSITMASYLDNPALLGRIVGGQFLSLVFGISGLMLCFFVPPHDIRARLVSLLWLLIGIGIAAASPTGWTSLGEYTTRVVAAYFIAWAFVIAHLYFPAPSFAAARRKRIVYAFTAAVFLLSALNTLEDWVLLPHALSLVRFMGIEIYDILRALLGLSFLISAALLVRHHFRSRDPDIRRQTGIIFWGTALGIGPFIAGLLASTFWGGFSSIVHIYTAFSVVLTLLAYTYVIHQRKLLRIDFIINQVVVIFVLVWVTLTISFLVLGIIAWSLNLSPELPLLGGALLAFLSPFSENWHRMVHRFVNRVLYGSDYDFSSVTSDFSNRLVHVIDRDTLIDFLTHDLAHQMGIRQAALFLAEGGGLQLQRPEAGPCFIHAGDELLKALLNSQKPVRALDLGQFSPTAPANWQRFDWAQLFVPIIFEGRLEGILVLGHRTSGDVYSDQDLQIIATIARQSALAYANVQLVETLRGLNQQLVRTDEAQRKQVARELHDTVLQQLFFIKQHLLRDQSQFTLVSLLDEAIQTLRHTIRDQRPPFLDQGVQLALRGLVEEMQKLAGPLPIILWCSNVNGRLPLTDEQATALYRIAQEALANALKHGCAQNVTVTLDVESDGILRLGIADDGVGMPMSAQGARDGERYYGLVGMRERAFMVNAQLHIASALGEGTKVTVEIPPRVQSTH